MRWVILGTVVSVALGCGGENNGEGPDAGSDGSSSGGGDAARPDAAGNATYHDSLSVCWTDAACPRVMAIAHGGMWDTSSMPYDSDAAIAAAYEAGYEGVKIDVRITQDGVPVIAHSSPIETFESLDCAGKKIEEMTADQVTSCHRFPSSTETFQRLDQVLEVLRGKMVAELTVKRSVDYAATIADVLELDSGDYAFFEISTAELEDQIPDIAGGDRVYYLVNVASDLSQIDRLLDVANPRAFMVEVDPDVELGDLVETRLHPAGVRAFTYDSSPLLSVSQIEGYYEDGYDVVSSQSKENGVTARVSINQERGVSPP